MTFILWVAESTEPYPVVDFFGFELFVDGEPVKFGRGKIQGASAYLVDHRGASSTTAEAYAALFEDAQDTTSGKSYFRTILHEMIKTLKKAGAEEILLKGYNSYSIVPEKFDCDYYRFLEGDPESNQPIQKRRYAPVQLGRVPQRRAWLWESINMFHWLHDTPTSFFIDAAPMLLTLNQ